jgi:ABC-2 type transport system permease protein
MHHRPKYLSVFLMFARNSLVREMTFRANFLIELISSFSWSLMNLAFYTLVYNLMGREGRTDIAGWSKYEFFVFIATTIFVNSLVEAFFMDNAEELSELTRTGGLDFALLKPIDTQFLVSLRKINWSGVTKLVLVAGLLAYSLPRIENLHVTPIHVALYLLYVVLGVMILYSVMIALAATSIWLGRNQSLYDFWFYITNFSRYPMEIYQTGWGWSLWFVFTFIVPVLVVVNVPARLLAQPLRPREAWEWWLMGFAVVATIGSLAISRWIFKRALRSYRSASS